MERRLLSSVADRVLAFRRGERPVDPVERDRLARLAELVGGHLDPRARRRTGSGSWTRERVTDALAALAAEQEAVSGLILRLSAPAGERPVGRPRRDGQPAAAGNRVDLHVGGGVGIAAGRDVTIGGGDPARIFQPLPSPAGDAEPAPRGGGRAAPEPEPIPGPRPDLELRVTRGHDAGDVVLDLELLVQEPGLEARRYRSEPIRLRAEPEAYVSGLFREIQSSGTGRRLESALAAIGGDLSRRLLPEELSRPLWELRHHDRTLLLRSDEPWIPWELLRLRGPAGELGPFLCEAFSMTRWLDGCPPPAPALPLRRIAVVAPRIDDPRGVSPELTELLRRDGSARSVEQVPARYQPLVEALAAGAYDGWHFCGHGLPSDDDPDAAAVPLEDYRRLMPRDLGGEARGCGRSRPLVFLNGCHTGRGGWALTGIGGWAEQFLAAGAGAFIGTWWAVDGDAAAELARTFYQCFCDRDVPFGKAIRRAREATRESGDATWLAYVAYGHPRAGR